MSNNEQLNNFSDRIIREAECRHLTGLCRTTRYVMEKKGTFPARCQLGGRSVGWRLSEVQSWIANQLTAQTSNAA